MLEASVARRVRLVGLDVDGVLTDNGVYLGAVDGHAVELKRFHIQDGLGIKLLQQAGLKVVLVSGRESPATVLRASELGVDGLLQDGAARKLPALERLLAEHAMAWEEIAFVGDDLADLPVLRRVGLPIAVANAVGEVREAAHAVTTAAGGAGAVREVAELLLRARGEWNDVLRNYLAERGDAAGRLSGVR